jgi:hypothetical protein
MPCDNLNVPEGDDLRQFIRELLLRSDKRAAAVAAQVREEQRITREENRVYFEQLRAETREIIAENRAQRECLFKILDQLRGGGPATAS